MSRTPSSVTVTAGRAGEAVAREQRRRDAGVRAEARPSFSIDGWAHTRRIWPRGPQYSAMPSASRSRAIVELQQPSAHRGARERIPRAGAVIVGRRCDAARCRRAFRSRNRARGMRGTRRRRSARRRQRSREQRRQHGHARVTLGQHVPVVPIERVDRRSAGECRAGNACTAPVEQHARPTVDGRHLRRGIAVDDGRGRRARAARRDTDEIEQAALRLRNDIARDRVELQRADEPRDVRHRRTRSCDSCYGVGQHFILSRPCSAP